ncbi:hypothetical protein G210_2109 [Candida maltosa Xu316]|uniref:Uncharacterized protein n=1 Tax=Candida maltosa (strain Xu316) TaxID=1245528 RepID=M3HJJ6_CANMX|nr:hypothetical protein G210_2109 [Candida maltosa Xu316]
MSSEIIPNSQFQGGFSVQTKILTNFGFIDLAEVEERIDEVLFGKIDVATGMVKFRPAKILTKNCEKMISLKITKPHYHLVVNEENTTFARFTSGYERFSHKTPNYGIGGPNQSHPAGFQRATFKTIRDTNEMAYFRMMSTITRGVKPNKFLNDTNLLEMLKISKDNERDFFYLLGCCLNHGKFVNDNFQLRWHIASRSLKARQLLEKLRVPFWVDKSSSKWGGFIITDRVWKKFMIEFSISEHNSRNSIPYWIFLLPQYLAIEFIMGLGFHDRESNEKKISLYKTGKESIPELIQLGVLSGCSMYFVLNAEAGTLYRRALKETNRTVKKAEYESMTVEQRENVRDFYEMNDRYVISIFLPVNKHDEKLDGSAAFLYYPAFNYRGGVEEISNYNQTVWNVDFDSDLERSYIMAYTPNGKHHIRPLVVGSTKIEETELFDH